MPEGVASRRLAARRALLLAPLAAAGVTGGASLLLLLRMKAGRYDPHFVPNLLVGHPVPLFALSPLPLGQNFSSADLRSPPYPVLVNVFASWCVACRLEHPILVALRSRGVAIWGVDYDDSEKSVAAWLALDGNPYARIGADPKGEAAIAWGISGVPETFFVDRHGIIRWHIAGPLTHVTVADTLDPLLRKYR